MIKKNRERMEKYKSLGQLIIQFKRISCSTQKKTFNNFVWIALCTLSKKKKNFFFIHHSVIAADFLKTQFLAQYLLYHFFNLLFIVSNWNKKKSEACCHRCCRQFKHFFPLKLFFYSNQFVFNFYFIQFFFVNLKILLLCLT